MIEMVADPKVLSLEEETVYVLMELPFSDFSEGYCILKNNKNQYGRVNLDDAYEYKWNIRALDSGRVIAIFPNLQDLIKAGWFIG